MKITVKTATVNEQYRALTNLVVYWKGQQTSCGVKKDHCSASVFVDIPQYIQLLRNLLKTS